MNLTDGAGSGPNPDANVPSGITAALLPSIGPVIQSVLEAKNAQQNTDKTIAANKELAQYGYSKDLEQWNRSNAYNTPQAQMDRLKIAGLNPNLVYGSGSASGNTTPAQSPRYQAPTVQYNYKNPVNAMAMTSAYQDMQMRQAEIDNVRANTMATVQKAKNDIIRERLLGLDEYGRPSLNSILDSKARLAYNSVPYQLSMQQNQVRQGELQNDLALQGIALGKKNLAGADLENERKRLDNQFKRYENEWRKMGITSSDNPLFRVFGRLMNEADIASPGELIKRMLSPGNFSDVGSSGPMMKPKKKSTHQME